jgi:hypothetical protein
MVPTIAEHLSLTICYCPNPTRPPCLASYASIKLTLFLDLVKVGVDTIMPRKSFKLHVNDPLWVLTPEIKKLIKLITPESLHTRRTRTIPPTSQRR